MPNSKPQRKYRTEYVSNSRRITAGYIVSVILVAIALVALFLIILSLG
jgi:hypothetical protein